jgi:hypothetical protein
VDAEGGKSKLEFIAWCQDCARGSAHIQISEGTMGWSYPAIYSAGFVRENGLTPGPSWQPCKYRTSPYSSDMAIVSRWTNLGGTVG